MRGSLHDSQPQSGAQTPIACDIANLIKLFEYPLELMRFNADPVSQTSMRTLEEP